MFKPTRSGLQACVLTHSVRSGALTALLLGGASTLGAQMPDPIPIRGGEHVAWNQNAPNDVEVRRYKFFAYTRNARVPMPDAVCQQGPSAGEFECSASLPSLSSGLQVVQIATVKEVGGLPQESQKSSAIYLLVEPLADASGLPASARGSSESLSAARSEAPIPAVAPAALAVDVLAIGLDAPSGLATTPDGRIFIAERSGALRVWESGQLRRDPAIVLPDAASLGDAGLIGLTVHPDFATNHLVYVVYTQRSDTGALANRVVRYRELNNVFAQAAILLEDAASERPLHASRIKFGPDRKLYVSFAAGTDRSAVDSFASYVGKILRLNDDGSTPSDNPGGSPVIAYGHRAPTAFAWQPVTGVLWLTERDWTDRDQLGRMPPGAPAYPLDSVDPSGATFLSTSVVSGFKDGLFIAAFDGQHIRQVSFDPADSTRVLGTTRLVDHEFGRISDVVAGADGALYFCTSGSADTSQTQGSDRLVRLTPLVAATPTR